MRQTTDGKHKPGNDVDPWSRQRHKSVSPRRFRRRASNKRTEHVHTHLFDLRPDHPGSKYVTGLMDRHVQNAPEKEDGKSDQYLADLICCEMPDAKEKRDHS